MVRRHLLERRDTIAILTASYLSLSAAASNPKMDVDASIDIVRDARQTLVESAFPYFSDKREEKQDDENPDEKYAAYFDELDELERLQDKSTGQPEDGKAQNDIMET